MTKKAIITSILNELKQPFNYELYNRIGDRVLALRAKYLRQSMGKYGIDELLQQSYNVPMIKKTDANKCIYYVSDCKILMPIRISNQSSPFKFVGTVTNHAFTFLRVYETDTIPNIPINAKHKYYSIENMKIRVYNAFPKNIKVIDVFESFEELINMCDNGNCIEDDIILPMPADFVDLIIKDLVQELSPLQQVNNNTEVEK